MKKENVEIGMKVVPFQKTSRTKPCSDMEDYKKRSSEASQFFKENGFLYVLDFSNQENAFVLGSGRNLGGDFFCVEDFESYDVYKRKQYTGRKITFLKEIIE